MKKFSWISVSAFALALGMQLNTVIAQEATTAPAATNDDKPSKKEVREARKQARDEYWTNFRNYDKTGINVFEPAKEATKPFDKVKVRFGAGFTQQFQMLSHENARTKGENSTTPDLYPRLGSGFAIAQANLYLDAMLAEGIQLNVTTYLASRHHNESWVKGGYIQIDKLPFKGEFWDKLMQNVRVKAGHFGINYGDAQFRRSDGGNAIYNPFMENYIMDEFATEVAAEVYYMKNGFTAMGAISNGLINGGFQRPLMPGSTTETYKRSPSLYGKLAYDKQFSDKLRGRVAASVYHNNSDGRSTLMAGDRTGSNYYFVLEGTTANAKDNAFSGRLNGLNFSQQITAAQFNGFVKYAGLELFGTYEKAKGGTMNEKVADKGKRSVDQYAIDGVYRIGANENLFVGARYNMVTGQMIPGNFNKQSIDRVALAAGWVITTNVLMKAELVKQQYKDFPTSDIRAQGKFTGYVIEAIVGF